MGQDIKKVMQSKALGHMIKISKRLPARNKHLAKVLMPLLKASVRSALEKADKIVRTRRMRNKKKKRAMADAAVDPWDQSAKGKAALSKKKAGGKAKKKKKAGKKKKVGTKKTKKKKTKKTGAKRTASSKKVVKKKEEEEEEVLMQKISIKSFIARQLKAAKTVLPQANRAVQAKKNSLQNLLKAVKKEEKKVAKKKVTKKKKV